MPMHCSLFMFVLVIRFTQTPVGVQTMVIFCDFAKLSIEEVSEGHGVTGLQLLFLSQPWPWSYSQRYLQRTERNI